MANTIDQDLIQQLVDDTDITDIVEGLPNQRIHYNHVPESYLGTYIFFHRITAGEDEDRILNEQPGRKYQFRETFIVEAISRDLDDQVALVGELRKYDSHRDTLGTGTIQAIFVRNAADDYIPKGVDSDEGYHVGSLEFEIVGYAEAA